MNKPVIVVCSDEEHAEHMKRRLKSCGCPFECGEQDCPEDENGNELSCSACWELYTEVVVKQ